MKVIELSPDELKITPELSRAGGVKAFEERLRSSIKSMGLAEPLKVARDASGDFVVIDGAMRLRAIREIRSADSTQFVRIPVYVFDYSQRFEIRYQSDVYQDLLPSQMAVLVEHLHQSENVLKADIARFIGVSPATLRNYTGLWRLLQRGGLFAQLVKLMDVSIIPSSNPYAWLRLTEPGVRHVLKTSYSEGQEPEAWINQAVTFVRQGRPLRFPISYVEATTDSLPAEFYRVDREVRIAKKVLGLRKGGPRAEGRSTQFNAAWKNLEKVATNSSDPILRSAARALQGSLK